MIKPQLPNPLPLAQVHTPTGTVWYIPRANSYNDFLVQRRYHGTGSRFYVRAEETEPLFMSWEHLVPSLVPFLNLGAVQAASLDVATILAWSAAHPGQIFSHPTYAALCLRWGDNPYGYRVTTQTLTTAVNANSVFFTPHTCWLTGTTYYQLDLAAAEPVFQKLITRAGLLPHEQEFGQEGSWPGWYVTDLLLTRQALAEINHQLVISCAQIVYGVWVYPDSPCPEHWLSFHTAAEEALAYYQRLPEMTNPHSRCPTVMWGYATHWPGREPVWACIHEKELDPVYMDNLLQQKINLYPALLLSRPLYRSEVAEVEVPLSQRIPTLREVLNASGLSRWQLTQGLGWSLEKLRQRESRPQELTLREVQQVAALVEIPKEQLLAWVQDEIHARNA